VNYFNWLYDKYAAKANFLLVYILEAHAVNEWPIGSPLKFKQHTTVKERAAVAREFISALNWKIPTVLDDIDNGFENTYASWPLRFYIIDKGVMAVKAMPKAGAYYELTEIEDWLKARFH
jgi:hypothetical protein